MRFRPRTRLATSAALAAGLALTMTGAAGASSFHPSSGSSHAAGRDAAFDHIFVIMLENHSQSSVIDDPNAPYLTSLAHTYGMADQYYGVTHPSMPNYLAAIAAR